MLTSWGEGGGRGGVHILTAIDSKQDYAHGCCSKPGVEHSCHSCDVYSTLRSFNLPLNQIQIPAVTNEPKAKFWVGKQLTLNNDGIKNKQWTYCNKNKQRVRLPGVAQKITSMPVDCDAPCDYVGPTNQCMSVTGNGTKFYAGYVTVSQTYCDWNAWVAEPENVLRDFKPAKILEKHADLDWFKFNINAFCSCPVPIWPASTC